MSEKYDFEHIWTLIQIAEKAQLHPNLKNITAAAAAELDAIANPPPEPEEVMEDGGPDPNEPPLGSAPAVTLADNGRRV